MSSESTSSPTVTKDETVVKETEKQVQVNLNDLSALQAVDVIYRLLNKAATQGVYSIDESHALKVLITRVVRELNENTKVSSE
tara:strand:- start:62 stop:310 length:249 start_codon:yes stop_codon:yes gene_type:complete